MFLVDLRPACGGAMHGEDVAEEFTGERPALGALESLFKFNHGGQFFARSSSIPPPIPFIIHQPLGKGLRKLSERKLVVQHHAFGRRSHARRTQLGMEGRLAALAGEFDVLDAELLLGDHRSTEDGSAVAAAGLGTRSVLCPECVDDFRSFVAIVLPLLWREVERIEIGRHLLHRRPYRPASPFETNGPHGRAGIP